MSKEQLYSCLVDIKRLQEHPSRLQLRWTSNHLIRSLFGCLCRQSTSSVANIFIATWTMTDCNLSWTESKKSTSNMSNSNAFFLLTKCQHLQRYAKKFDVFIWHYHDGSYMVELLHNYDRWCFSFSESVTDAENEKEYQRLLDTYNMYEKSQDKQYE